MAALRAREGMAGSLRPLVLIVACLGSGESLSSPSARRAHSTAATRPSPYPSVAPKPLPTPAPPLAPSPALQRRAFFLVATASVTAGRASGVANAVPAFLADAPELKPPPGRPPNAPPSGPLANTPLGYKVGGGPRPEAEVREIDKARYAKVAPRVVPDKVPSFLDGVPREARR